MATSRDTDRLDEDDVRVRPGRRSTRPRSKQRPAHEDASDGMVLTVDRGRYNVLVDGAEVTAMRARELGRKGIAVGDRVGVVGDVSGAADTLARIVRVDERSTVLRRTADDDDPYERVIVANADQLVIVAALADPPPSYGLIDRCLVAALSAGLEPLLCLTKADLAPPDETLERYSALSVPAIVTQRGGSAGRVARPAARPDLGAGRALRGRQVDADQRRSSRPPTARPDWSARSARAGTPPRPPSRCRCPVARAG